MSYLILNTIIFKSNNVAFNLTDPNLSVIA